MRIAVLAPSVYMSKAAYPDRIFAPRLIILELVEGLAAKGHEVTLFSSSDIETNARLVPGAPELLKGGLLRDKYLSRDSLPEYILQSKIESQHIYSLDLIGKAFSKASESSFDIIQTDDMLVHSFVSLSKTPVTFILHDPLPKENSLDYWLLNRYKDHNFISISMAQRNGNPQINFIGNVYHGISINSYKASFERGEYFAYMGRLLVQKGVDLAIKAVKEQGERMLIAADNTHFNTDYVKNDIFPFLDEKVRYEGYFETKEEKNDFLGKAKALLFPIRWQEPFGLVMIEAMACGTPVIAFANGSVPEIIEDGKTGFLINPDDQDIRGSYFVKQTGVAGLSEAIRRINEMTTEELTTMRKNCRKLVEENFTIEKMVDGYEKAYNDLIAGQ